MKSLLPILVLGALAAPAEAGMLYKSVGPNGTIMFSDIPPSGDARILEQREIPSAGSPARASSAGGVDATQLIDADAAVARANVKVDLAEHALALARRGTWSPGDGLKLSPTRASRTDEERIEFYKRDVLAARQALMELLRERMLASR